MAWLSAGLDPATAGRPSCSTSAGAHMISYLRNDRLTRVLYDRGQWILLRRCSMARACVSWPICWRRAWRSPQPGAKRVEAAAREALAPAFWASAGALFVILAISREVDLASHIAGIGRSVFRTEGWYPDRRPLQKLVILAVLGIGGVATLVGAALLVAHGRSQLAFGFVAMMALGVFLVVRAISWHDIDGVLYRSSIESVQVNAIAELAVTGIAGLAAAVATIAPSRARNRRAGGSSLP